MKPNKDIESRLGKSFPDCSIDELAREIVDKKQHKLTIDRTRIQLIVLYHAHLDIIIIKIFYFLMARVLTTYSIDHAFLAISFY